MIDLRVSISDESNLYDLQKDPPVSKYGTHKVKAIDETGTPKKQHRKPPLMTAGTGLSWKAD